MCRRLPELRKDTLDAVTRYMRRTPTASVRSVGVVQAIWSPALAAEVPAAANETILECGHTTNVSIPSAILVEAGAGAGAGLLLNRAGTVNERRLLCRGGGACPEVLEGASGEDMVAAHACACISVQAVSCYVSRRADLALRLLRVSLLLYCVLLTVES